MEVKSYILIQVFLHKISKYELKTCFYCILSNILHKRLSVWETLAENLGPVRCLGWKCESWFTRHNSI